MLAIYLFFTTFQLVASITCAVLCFKIGKLGMTPTLTFMLLGIAFSMRVLSQLHGLFYISDLVNFVSGYSTRLVVGSNIFGAITIACFLIAFFRIYAGLKMKGV